MLGFLRRTKEPTLGFETFSATVGVLWGGMRRWKALEHVVTTGCKRAAECHTGVTVMAMTLHAAAASGDMAVVRSLVAGGADVEEPGERGLRLLPRVE